MLFKILLACCILTSSISAHSATTLTSSIPARPAMTHLKETINADGSVSLVLLPGPGPKKNRPEKLSENREIRKAVVDFFGYQEGGYIKDSTAGTLISKQVLTSLNSQATPNEYAIPKNLKMISGINEGTRGESRAALLFDDSNKLLAVALVSRDCHRNLDREVFCNDDKGHILNIFLPKGAHENIADPLIPWSKKIPTEQTIFMAYVDPDRTDWVQKIAKTLYITTQPNIRSWTPNDLPAELPKEFIPLLLTQSQLVGAGVNGKYTVGEAKGWPFSKDFIYSLGAPTQDFEVHLRTYTPIDEIQAFYTYLTTTSSITRNDHNITILGTINNKKYAIELRSQHYPHAINHINFKAWK